MSKTRDIREAVEAELRFDPLVDSSGVMVKNMDGAVALDGTVPGYPQYLQAAAAARRVAAEHDAVVSATWMADGVYAVIDELHVTG